MEAERLLGRLRHGRGSKDEGLAGHCDVPPAVVEDAEARGQPEHRRLDTRIIGRRARCTGSEDKISSGQNLSLLYGTSQIEND